MTASLIRAARIVTPEGVLESGAVLMEGARIVAIDRADRISVPDGVLERECDVLLPGFIDLHVHGSSGHGFGEGPDGAREAAGAMARSGVTTCYAGLGSGPSLAEIGRTVAGAAEVVDAGTGGARIAGIFMEGPFISVEKKGAWNPANLRMPSLGDLAELVAASGGRIRRVNVAPELPGALEFIRGAREQGIVVSLGHSNATYDEAVAGIDAGASVTNHTFNAMSPFDHRNPGLAGATLDHDELLAELILDHVHVHPAAAAILLRARGWEGVALITDGSMMAGRPDGTYEMPGRTVIVKDGSCRLPNGTLAGSVAAFDQGLRNASRLIDGDLIGLAALSSGNAATAMGISHETGAIKAGHFADLVLLSNRLEVRATVVRGQVVFETGANDA